MTVLYSIYEAVPASQPATCAYTQHKVFIGELSEMNALFWRGKDGKTVGWRSTWAGYVVEVEDLHLELELD